MVQAKTATVYWITGGVVVIILLGVGGYKLMHHAMTMQSPQVVSQAQRTSPTTNADGLSNKTDTSNQQLDQDMQDIQNSMNQLQQDQTTSSQDSSSKDVPQQ